MKCDVAQLSALADGDLSARAAKKVRAHVDGCASCARALADLETVKRGLGALPERGGEDNWSIVVNRLAQPVDQRRVPALSWSWARWALPSLALVAMLAGGGAWLH